MAPGKEPALPHNPAPLEFAGEPTADEVRSALQRVCSSPQFANSQRLQRFLTYVVEKKLDGAIADIKEYNLALSVFDREATFDARTDTIVRVEARRLRQQLAAYYQNGGHTDAVAIDLPQRGYVPVFRLQVTPVTRTAPRRPNLWYLGVAPIVALVGFAAAWHFGWIPQSRVPHSWDIENERVRIVDAHERLCWEIRLPKLHQQFAALAQDRVLIEDIDGDGRKEVLINYVPEPGTPGGGRLLCYDSRGHERWRFRYGAEKQFGTRRFDQSYNGQFVRLVHVDGKPRLVVTANHYLWYPSQMALLDPADGRVLGEYWHPGAIHHCLVIDADGDGRDEILFAAINNPGEGLGHPAVGLLKLPFAKWPADASALTGGGEARYVLLPRPDVNAATGYYPLVHHIRPDSDGRVLVQMVTPEYGAIVYHLNTADLTFREVRFADNLRPLHARLTQQRLLDHPLSDAELASYRTIPTFPSAPDGNSPDLDRFWKF